MSVQRPNESPITTQSLTELHNHLVLLFNLINARPLYANGLNEFDRWIRYYGKCVDESAIALMPNKHGEQDLSSSSEYAFYNKQFTTPLEQYQDGFVGNLHPVRAEKQAGYQMIAAVVEASLEEVPKLKAGLKDNKEQLKELDDIASKLSALVGQVFNTPLN